MRALSLQDLVQSSELQIAGTIFAPRLSVQSRPAIVGSGVVGIAGQPSTSVMPAAGRRHDFQAGHGVPLPSP